MKLTVYLSFFVNHGRSNISDNFIMFSILVLSKVIEFIRILIGTGRRLVGGIVTVVELRYVRAEVVGGDGGTGQGMGGGGSSGQPSHRRE